MYKKIFAGLVLFGLFSILVAACAIRDTANTSNLPTVHMGGADFIQHTITIPKGSMLLLVDDAPSEHIIQNGFWVNGTAKTAVEPGAPTVNVTYNGNDSSPIGPFNTAGTFHLYCTISREYESDGNGAIELSNSLNQNVVCDFSFPKPENPDDVLC